jgi:hypothetical protein
MFKGVPGETPAGVQTLLTLGIPPVRALTQITA